jgi:hypothetical protein
MESKRIQIKWKILAVAILLLTVATVAIVIFQEANRQSPVNRPSNPSSTPTPTETPPQFVVTSVTASPSNTTHPNGDNCLVTIVAEVENHEAHNDTVLVIMRIQEPNGNIMSLPDNSSTIEIHVGGSNTTTFRPVIPLNVKIGKFNVDIDVYDLNQTTQYYSTGYIYPFTTPMRFYITYLTGARSHADAPPYDLTVDGVVYPESSVFYWYLETNHTVSVPEIVLWDGFPGMNPDAGVILLGWVYDESPNIVSDGNVLHVYVTKDTPTTIDVDYGHYP